METFLVISTICLWIIVVFQLLLMFALVRRLNAKGNSLQGMRQQGAINLKVGDRAPDFTAQRLNGETVTLASFIGQKIALIFISTHCQPCEELLPKIKQLKEAAIRTGIELVLVGTEKRDVIRHYVEMEAIHLPVLVAPRTDTTFLKDYKVFATPAFCFITAQGIIYSVGSPYFEGEQWADFTAFSSEEPQLLEAKGGDTEEIGSR